MQAMGRNIKTALSLALRGASIVCRKAYCAVNYIFSGFTYGKTHPSNYIAYRANIRGRDNIYLGRDFRIYPGATLWCISFTAGDNVSINLGSHVFGNVTLGNHVMIAPNVVIAGGSHGTELNGTPMLLQPSSSKGVTIGDDVWIGANAVILDGVTLGNGVIVGAGAVVTKSVDENMVVAGNPASVIRHR